MRGLAARNHCAPDRGIVRVCLAAPASTWSIRPSGTCLAPFLGVKYPPSTPSKILHDVHGLYKDLCGASAGFPDLPPRDDTLFDREARRITRRFVDAPSPLPPQNTFFGLPPTCPLRYQATILGFVPRFLPDSQPARCFVNSSACSACPGPSFRFC